MGIESLPSDAAEYARNSAKRDYEKLHTLLTGALDILSAHAEKIEELDQQIHHLAAEMRRKGQVER